MYITKYLTVVEAFKQIPSRLGIFIQTKFKHLESDNNQFG